MMERDNLDLINELKHGDLDLFPNSDPVKMVKVAAESRARIAAAKAEIPVVDSLEDQAMWGEALAARAAKSSEVGRDEASVAQPETLVAAQPKVGDWWTNENKRTKGPRPPAPPGLAWVHEEMDEWWGLMTIDDAQRLARTAGHEVLVDATPWSAPEQESHQPLREGSRKSAMLKRPPSPPGLRWVMDEDTWEDVLIKDLNEKSPPSTIIIPASNGAVGLGSLPSDNGS